MQKCSSSLSASFTPFYPRAQRSQANSEIDGYDSTYGASSGTCASAGANFYNLGAYSVEPYNGGWASEGLYHWGNAWQWCDSSRNYQYGAYVSSMSSSEAVQEEYVSPLDVTRLCNLPSREGEYISEESGEYRSSFCQDGRLLYDPIEKAYSNASGFSMESCNQSSTVEDNENADMDTSTIHPVSVPQIVIPVVVQTMDDLSLRLGPPTAKEDAVFLKSHEGSVNDTKASLDDCSSVGQRGKRMEHEDVPCGSRFKCDGKLRPTLIFNGDNNGISAAVIKESKDFSSTVTENEVQLSMHNEIAKSDAMNGNEFLISSIYNLSTVLARNSSGDHAYNLKHSIYLLSECLLQLSSNVALTCTESAQELKSLQGLKLQEPVCKDKLSVCNYLASCGVFIDSVLQDLSKISCKKEDGQAGAILHGINLKTPWNDMRSTESNDDDVQISYPSETMNKELANLQAELLKLKEQVSYERRESNVLLGMYKKLWLEMQEEVERCRSCAEKAKKELQSLELSYCEARHSDFEKVDTQGSESISLEHPNKFLNREMLKKQLLANNRGSCEIFSDYVMISSDEIVESKSICNLDLNRSSDVHEAMLRYSLIQARNKVSSHDGNDARSCMGYLPDICEKEMVGHLALLLKRPAFDLNEECGPGQDLELDTSQCVPTSMVLDLEADVSHYISAGFDPVLSKHSQVPQDNIILQEIKDGRKLGDTNLEVKEKVGRNSFSGGHCNPCDEDEIICLRPSDSTGIECKVAADWEHMHMPSL